MYDVSMYDVDLVRNRTTAELWSELFALIAKGQSEAEHADNIRAELRRRYKI